MHAFTDHEDNVAEMMADILRAHAHGTAEHRRGAPWATCDTETVAPASLTMELSITSKATPNTPITVATPIGEITLTNYTHRTDPLSFVTFEAWQGETQIPVVLGNNSPRPGVGAESAPHVRVILTNVTIADDPVLRISATATASGTGDAPCTLTCTQSYLGKSQTITLQKNGVSSEPLYLVAEFHPKETTGNATIVLCPGGWASELFAADNDVQIVIDEITAGQ